MKTAYSPWWGAALAVSSLIGLGCDAPSDDGSEGAGKPVAALELGELEGRVFTPYEAAQALEIHQGLQGGFHIFVDGRLVGDELDECLITLRMFRFDDGLEIATIQHLREPDLLPDNEGNRTLNDLIVFIPDPELVDGRDVRLEASFEYEGEAAGSDEVLLHLRLVP